ncbi:MAG TPA: hypothetical protein VE987_14135, partial [Polyangiaceae bacterium]|nr:hypothetical protein [Polyangiaceae bacterium]
GKVLLHFGEVDGAGMRVQLQALEIREQFNVVAGALFLKAAVTTDGIARAASDAGGPIAEGTLLGRTLRWSTPVRGFRQDGTVTCEGSLCGKFGGPPQGRSGMHSGPDAVSFQPFEFAGDLKTFTMRFSVISSSDSPKHRSFLAIAGREVRRACASTDDPR